MSFRDGGSASAIGVSQSGSPVPESAGRLPSVHSKRGGAADAELAGSRNRLAVVSGRATDATFPSLEAFCLAAAEPPL